jgi:hypothetical protein
VPADSGVLKTAASASAAAAAAAVVVVVAAWEAAKPASAAGAGGGSPVGTEPAPALPLAHRVEPSYPSVKLGYFAGDCVVHSVGLAAFDGRSVFVQVSLSIWSHNGSLRIRMHPVGNFGLREIPYL